MNSAIRPASRADVPEMHRIRMRARQNRLADPERVSEASYLPFIEAGTTWIGAVDGNVVGFAVLDAPSSSVWALFVDPDAEGRGIGRALHGAAVQAAQQLEIAELCLSTSPGTRAEAFYERAGWQKAGIAPEGEQIFTLLLNRNPGRVDASVRQLWNRYRKANPVAPAGVPMSFHFCDNPEDADLCAALVVAGRKRATATSLAELELARMPLPRAGDYAVVTNWAGEAKAIIRTASVEIRRFNEVDKTFAAEEGEGDGTLAWWRSAHLAYYQRVLEGSSYSVDDRLQIACEYFEVLLTA